MTRIVAGSLGGRRLVAPPGERTRPTSDRVREALFSALDAAVDLDGARFVDLYAGSGAVGLEAYSRGAGHVLLVESDARAARVVRDNIAAVRAAPAVRLAAAPVAAVLAAGPGDGPYDVVFADPPYPVPAEEVAHALDLLVAHDWLRPGAAVVVERSARSVEPTWPTGLVLRRKKKYGETVLWYLRRHPEGQRDATDAVGDDGGPAEA